MCEINLICTTKPHGLLYVCVPVLYLPPDTMEYLSPVACDTAYAEQLRLDLSEEEANDEDEPSPSKGEL